MSGQLRRFSELRYTGSEQHFNCLRRNNQVTSDIIYVSNTLSIRSTFPSVSSEGICIEESHISLYENQNHTVITI